MKDRLLKEALPQALKRKTRIVGDHAKKGIEKLRNSMSELYKKYNSRYIDKSKRIHERIKGKLRSFKKSASVEDFYVPISEGFDAYKEGIGAAGGGLAGMHLGGRYGPYGRLIGAGLGTGLGYGAGLVAGNPQQLEDLLVPRNLKSQQLPPGWNDPDFTPWEMPDMEKKVMHYLRKKANEEGLNPLDQFYAYVPKGDLSDWAASGVGTGLGAYGGGKLASRMGWGPITKGMFATPGAIAGAGAGMIAAPLLWQSAADRDGLDMLALVPKDQVLPDPQVPTPEGGPGVY